MEKRLFLAILFSLLIIISWSALSSKFYPAEQQRVTQIEPLRIPALSTPSAPSTAPILAEPPELPEESMFIDQREISFIIPYGAIKEVVFGEYQQYRFTLFEGLRWKQSGVVFEKQKLGRESYFIYEDQEKRVIKNFIFYKSNYSIDLNIKITNLKETRLNLNPCLILAKVDLEQPRSEGRFKEAIFAYKDKVLRRNLRKEFVSDQPVRFLGFRNRYFCIIVEPEAGESQGFVNKLNTQNAELGLSSQMSLEPGEEKDLNFLIYLGPQDLRILSTMEPEWQQVIYYGAFDGISKLLLRFLTFLQSITHNWGFALVLLTFCIYIILYPLTLKQMRSMKRMQDLQPKIEQLRQLYKNNSQKLNKEVLELYRAEKINPLGGCFPLILQMPIFFALYQALMRSLVLKGANFLWIKDLSQPDRLFILPQALPFMGNEINLLPLLMMAVMFLQQKISHTSTLGSAAEQQRLMTLLFPLLFGIIFYHMPSGLVLYWFINSLLMVLNQSRIRAKH